MRLSIVIPVLDEAASIVPQLEALQGFRARGHELILVDGGSRDETRTLAAPLVDRLLACGKGRARQMNLGARYAGGDLLVFLHADTRLPKDAERLLGNIQRGGDTWGRFDVRLSGAQVIFRFVELLMNLRSRMTGITTGDQALFVERALFQRVGGYPDIELMEDIRMSAVLRKISPPLCLRAKALTSSRRWEEKGILRTILLMHVLRLRFALGADPAILAKDYER